VILHYPINQFVQNISYVILICDKFLDFSLAKNEADAGFLSLALT